jgi:hypothetical protein
LKFSALIWVPSQRLFPLKKHSKLQESYALVSSHQHRTSIDLGPQLHELYSKEWKDGKDVELVVPYFNAEL